MRATYSTDPCASTEAMRFLRNLNASEHRAYCRLLRGYGASDADAPKAHFDVFISDLEMPPMDDIEFIRHLGTRGHHGSLIIASALDRVLLSAVETMTVSYGINLLGAIAKPVTGDARAYRHD